MNKLNENINYQILEVYQSFRWKFFLKILGLIYYGYLKFLNSSIKKYKNKICYIDCLDNDIKLLDYLATQLGAAFRGAGILVGILSMLILLCAFLPMCLDLNHEIKIILGVAEISLMLFSLLILWLIRFSELKIRWLEIRSATEKIRYKELSNLITINTDNLNIIKYDDLLSTITSLLDGGTKCQIEYNKNRLTEYENIEIFTTRLTYIGFVISFFAAISHLKLHINELFLFTAFVPSCVGVMHAINGFLRLPQMVAYHGEMVGNLSEVKSEVLALGVDKQSAQLVRLAERLLRYLENINEKWYGIAKHQDLHLV